MLVQLFCPSHAKYKQAVREAELCCLLTLFRGPAGIKTVFSFRCSYVDTDTVLFVEQLAISMHLWGNKILEHFFYVYFKFVGLRNNHLYEK